LAEKYETSVANIISALEFAVDNDDDSKLTKIGLTNTEI